MGSSASRPALCAWVLVALFAVLLFQRFASGPIWYDDEIKNAERAREVLLTGDLGAVQANFQPSFNKPPLHYWLTAVTFKALGEGMFAVRFWSVFFAVGTLALTVVLARTIAPELFWLPAVSVLFLGLHGPFLQYARIGLLDMGLTFWTLGTLVACERASRGQRRWWIVAGLLAGLGGLYKLPLPLAVWLVWLGVRGLREGGEARRALWNSRALWLGLGIATALSAAWPLFQFARFGAAWWTVYGGEESKGYLERRGTGAYFGPATYVVWLLQKWALFGGVALGGTVWVLWRGRRRDGPVAARFYEVAILAAAYLVIVGLMTIKSQRYLFPALPLLAVLGGAAVLSWAPRVPSVWRAALVAVAALGIAPVAWSDYRQRSKQDTTPEIPMMVHLGAAARPPETLLVVNRVRSKYFVLFFGRLHRPVVDVTTGKAGKIQGPLRGLVSSPDWGTLQAQAPGLEKVAEEGGLVEFARP